MSETTRFATYDTAIVTDETGTIIGTMAGWFDRDGRPITDAAEIARLEGSMPKGAFKDDQRVEWMTNNDVEPDHDDATWEPATVYRDQGAGVYLVRQQNGALIGVSADRLRMPAKETD